MTKNNLKEIETVAKAYNNDVTAIEKALKRVQSTKCRLQKQKGRSDYELKMAETLAEEQSLKEAKALLVPKKKFVTDYELEDVKRLDYDETVKALKSIQTKKTNTMWITETAGDNDEFRNACRIEQMLKEHRATLQPVAENAVRKTEVQTIIETIENNQELSKERLLEMLKNLAN